MDTWRDVTPRTLAGPNFPALFRQLEELANVPAAEWEAADFDPLSEVAVATADHVLNVLAIEPKSGAQRALLALELHASRDGGIVMIAGNREREVELAIGPKGAIGYVIVDLRASEPDKRYLREGEIGTDQLTSELHELFA